MTNYEKYFGTVEKTAETLENIACGKFKICDIFCKLSEKDCLLLDDFDCVDFIRDFLKKESE